MKTKELQALRSESIEKLSEKVMELKKEIVKAEMPSLGENPTNVKIAHHLKKNVAQIKTIITEKQKTN